MIIVRKILAGASLPVAFHMRAFDHFFGRELKVLTLGVTIVIGLTYIVPKSGILNRTNIFNPVTMYKSELSNTIAVPDLISDKKLNVKNSIKVEQLIMDDMAYTFDENLSGFLASDLSYLGKVSKAEVEKKILTTIPKPLSINAGKYLRAVLLLSEIHQVDPLWVLSIMWTESHFSYNATSSVGASGLMQIMPTTKQYLYKKLHRKGKLLVVEKEGFVLNDYFPYRVADTEYMVHRDKLFNIELGIIYLQSLLKRFDANHVHATVAYNMGPSWTKRQLRENKPVGISNEYLNKVSRAYGLIIEEI